MDNADGVKCSTTTVQVIRPDCQVFHPTVGHVGDDCNNSNAVDSPLTSSDGCQINRLPNITSITPPVPKGISSHTSCGESFEPETAEVNLTRPESDEETVTAIRIRASRLIDSDSEDENSRGGQQNMDGFISNDIPSPTSDRCLASSNKVSSDLVSTSTDKSNGIATNAVQSFASSHRHDAPDKTNGLPRNRLSYSDSDDEDDCTSNHVSDHPASNSNRVDLDLVATSPGRLDRVDMNASDSRELQSSKIQVTSIRHEDVNNADSLIRNRLIDSDSDDEHSRDNGASDHISTTNSLESQASQIQVSSHHPEAADKANDLTKSKLIDSDSDDERSEKNRLSNDCRSPAECKPTAQSFMNLASPPPSDSESDSDVDEHQIGDNCNVTEMNAQPRSLQPRASKSQALHEIYAESSRLMRESEISLPYHEAEQLPLDTFLQRKAKVKSSLPQIMKGAVRARDLKKYDKLLADRESKMCSIYDSDEVNVDNVSNSVTSPPAKAATTKSALHQLLSKFAQSRDALSRKPRLETSNCILLNPDDKPVDRTATKSTNKSPSMASAVASRASLRNSLLSTVNRLKKEELEERKREWAERSVTIDDETEDEAESDTNQSLDESVDEECQSSDDGQDDDDMAVDDGVGDTDVVRSEFLNESAEESGGGGEEDEEGDEVCGELDEAGGEEVVDKPDDYPIQEDHQQSTGCDLMASQRDDDMLLTQHRQELAGIQTGSTQSCLSELSTPDTVILGTCPSFLSGPELPTQSTQSNIDLVAGLCSGRFDSDPVTAVGDPVEDAASSESSDLSDEDESSVIQSGARPKRRVVEYSDDEANDVDEQSDAEEVDDLNDESSDCDDDDDEEMMLSKSIRQERMHANNFIEDEAELSGSEADHAEAAEADFDSDEDPSLNGLVVGDNETDGIDDGVILDQLGRLHHRRQVDEDRRQLLMLQEALLDDGELDDGSDKMRQRRFKWANLAVEEDATARPMRELEDLDMGEEVAGDDKFPSLQVSKCIVGPTSSTVASAENTTDEASAADRQCDANGDAKVDDTDDFAIDIDCNVSMSKADNGQQDRGGGKENTTRKRRPAWDCLDRTDAGSSDVSPRTFGSVLGRNSAYLNRLADAVNVEAPPAKGANSDAKSSSVRGSTKSGGGSAMFNVLSPTTKKLKKS